MTGVAADTASLAMLGAAELMEWSFLVATAHGAVVYERSALHLLRRAWINIDVVWAGSLVLTAAAVLTL